MSEKNLIKQIEELRSKLSNLKGNDNSLSEEEILKVSRKLDCLINKYYQKCLAPNVDK